MPSVRSDDALITYEVEGAGPPIVFLHPFPAHRGVWRPIAAELSARYRCVLPDLRGHGESEAGAGPATMAKHAADLARVCDDAGIERALFAGISIGGYVLFEIWRRYRERVSGMILCDTRAPADSDETRRGRLQSIDDVQKHGPDAFLDKQVERLLGASTRRNRPDVARAARDMMGKMSVAGIVAVQQGMAERPDSVPTLRTIDVPTLILCGDEDVVSPRADAELMQREIRGSRLEMISAAGHYSVFEQPQQALRAMRQFVDAQKH